MRVATLIGAVLLILLSACAPAPPADSHAFVGDFETGNFDQWADCQNIVVSSAPCVNFRGSSDSMQVESTVVRQGRYAARFEVRQGDTPAQLCCGARAEVSGEEALRADEGDDRWYQWSTRFGAGFPADRGWTVLSQWHADQDGPPPLAIGAGPTNVADDRWGIVVSTWNAPGDPGTTYTPWSGPIVPETWIDIKMHVKWSIEDSIGFVELWVDGTPQRFQAEPCAGRTRCMVRTLMPDGGGTYFKQGYYRDPQITPPGVVYHDGFSCAATEAELRPL
ncbi:polysaccharide lyase [Nocardia jejuensis]|uniref:polysaccharide lyase n=1 Tax=Nocardia jejuensis TaxID=328049 RepID=UPI0008304BC8|nr:polysaccharide lyase [Nocardia jejuensis]